MTFEEPLLRRAAELIDLCRARQLRVAAAESCTGGLVAGLITSIAGSSDVFEAGYVTYSNAAKVSMIDVPETLLAAHGAVSAEVAKAMAEGALRRSGAALAIAITGVAGPGGGTPLKPVGLVYLAAVSKSGNIATRQLRLGDPGREAVRLAAVAEAVAMLYALAAA